MGEKRLLCVSSARVGVDLVSFRRVFIRVSSCPGRHVVMGSAHRYCPPDLLNIPRIGFSPTTGHL